MKDDIEEKDVDDEEEKDEGIVSKLDDIDTLVTQKVSWWASLMNLVNVTISGIKSILGIFGR